MNSNKILSKIFGSLFIFAFIFLVHSESSSANTLTQEQKEALYKEYLEIMEEVKSTVEFGGSVADIEVSPIESFSDEDWVSPEVFKQRAIERAQSIVTNGPSKDFSALSTVSASKVKTIEHGSSNVNVTISATFTTQYNSSYGRQVITNFSNVPIKSSKGTWTTTGVDGRIIENGRTATFTIGGKLDYVGIVTSHVLNTDFVCSSTGKVS